MAMIKEMIADICFDDDVLTIKYFFGFSVKMLNDFPPNCDYCISIYFVQNWKD